ncbi:hypothetical protein [Methylomicrobium sp. Wu6]|uniref:hypothetical protein n=1 Tax=Methylomicrobium sp. Wu6 TaxID=3107928 RepID=UPI002DD6329F|nr:hypothetical protein [Methylomicrobium sp. Wu6]MEC4747909.1 hypothetical protein [Methylomicrobium sp. Wu6]
MFIYSLSILFNQINLLSPAEALFIMAGLFVIVWMLAPAPDGDFRQLMCENYWFSCWVGGQRLVAVFWPFFLVLNAVLFGADWLVKSGRLTVSSWDDVHFVLVLPIVWWTVSIWRCSARARFRWYGAGARFITICVFLEYALKLYLRIDYPRLFFNCEELLLDYGSCF